MIVLPNQPKGMMYEAGVLVTDYGISRTQRLMGVEISYANDVNEPSLDPVTITHDANRYASTLRKPNYIMSLRCISLGGTALLGMPKNVVFDRSAMYRDDDVVDELIGPELASYLRDAVNKNPYKIPDPLERFVHFSPETVSALALSARRRVSGSR